MRLRRGIAYSSWAQLDLEMGLVGLGVSGEDVEDHLGAVDDFDLEDPFQVSRLGRPQVVIEDDDVGFVGLDQFLELFDLARTNVGGDVDLLAFLQHGRHHVQAGGLGQPANLVQGIIMIRAVIGENDPDKDGSFLTPQTLGAF